MSILGWLLMIGAACLFGYTVIEANQPNHYWGSLNNTLTNGSIVSLIVGLVVEAFAEIIGVLFAIELNTRK